MSYHDKWCTKADILRDLAEVTGRLSDVDEKYIVTGKEPPPMRSMDDEDDEFNLRFGYNLCQGEYVVSPPDLGGISEMLRMVDEYNNGDDGVDLAPMKPSDHLVISKLNPEVPEFVPVSAPAILPKAPATDDPDDVPIHPTCNIKNKTLNDNNVHVNNSVRTSNGIHNDKANLNKEELSTNTKSCRTKKSNKTKFNNLNESKKSNGAKYDDLSFKTHFTQINGTNKTDDRMCSYNQVDLNNKEQKCDIDFKINKRLEISDLNENEINDMATKLRSKISEACSNDQTQSKREKNVAIATLLKLYSATSPRQVNSPPLENIDNADNQPIKLITPEYFETRPAKSSLDKNQVLCEVHGVTVDVGSNPNASNGTKVSKSPNTVIVGSSKNTRYTVNSNIQTDKEEKVPIRRLEEGRAIKNKYTEGSEIKNSIDKVNKWFEKPESPKPKGLTVCLGPIAFKRKTPITRSPVSDADRSSLSTPTSNELPQTTQYRPSKYAEDLSRKFMEQGKALEKQQLDVWQRAELVMKEKEELMRKKKLEQSCSSQETIDDTSSESR